MARKGEERWRWSSGREESGERGPGGSRGFSVEGNKRGRRVTKVLIIRAIQRVVCAFLEYGYTSLSEVVSLCLSVSTKIGSVCRCI